MNLKQALNHKKFVKSELDAIRFFDIAFSIFGLLFFAPLLIIICLLVRCTSRGNIFFQQLRVGKNGADFLLFKFRTMYVNADRGGLLTVGGRDRRITHLGYYLRKYKLDELPQLWNVLKGNMSIVGPRPEVRKYVDLYTEHQREVLSVKPGLTDYASIEFRNESEMLSQVSQPEEYYIKHILPRKIELNKFYINNKTVKEYFEVILKTQFSLYDFRIFLIRHKITPKWGIFIIDLVLSVIAMSFANYLSEGYSVTSPNFINSVIVTAATCSVLFFIVKPYDGIIKYSDLHEAFKIFATIFFSFGLLVFMQLIPAIKVFTLYNSSTLIIFFFIASVFMLLSRLFIKVYFKLSIKDNDKFHEAGIVNVVQTDPSFNIVNTTAPISPLVTQKYDRGDSSANALVIGSLGITEFELVKKIASELNNVTVCSNQKIESLSNNDSVAYNHIYIKDLKDKNALRSVFNSHRPEIVFHFLKQGNAISLENDPSEAVNSIVYQTKVIAELSATHKVKRLILVPQIPNEPLSNIVSACQKISELYCLTNFKGNPEISNHYSATEFVSIRVPRLFNHSSLEINSIDYDWRNRNLQFSLFQANYPNLISIDKASTILVKALSMKARNKVFQVNSHYELKNVRIKKYNPFWLFYFIDKLVSESMENQNLEVLELIKKIIPQYTFHHNDVYTGFNEIDTKALALTNIS